MIPRVASYYENRLGRNDGNPLYITNVFKRDYAGRIDYQHLIPDPAAPTAPLGRFDLSLWIDWGEDALKGVLPYEPLVPPRPALYWASDTHLGYDYRAAWARHFDYVFTAQLDGLPGATWLPHAVEPQAYNPAGQYARTTDEALEFGRVQRLKRWDLSFVGHLNDPTRVAALDRMFREFPSSWWGSMRTGRVFERAADVYTRSRVVFNHAINGDLNMRVFEVLATRSCLLTPTVPGMTQLGLEDGVNLVTYRDLNEAVEKARYYIDHDEARERVAQAGYDEVVAKHTFAHRVARMLEAAGLTPTQLGG